MFDANEETYYAKYEVDKLAVWNVVRVLAVDCENEEVLVEWQREEGEQWKKSWIPIDSCNPALMRAAFTLACKAK